MHAVLRLIPSSQDVSVGVSFVLVPEVPSPQATAITAYYEANGYAVHVDEVPSTSLSAYQLAHNISGSIPAVADLPPDVLPAGRKIIAECRGAASSDSIDDDGSGADLPNAGDGSSAGIFSSHPLGLPPNPPIESMPPHRTARESLGSLAKLVHKANLTVDDNKLWGVAATIGLVIVVVYSLAYVIVEYGMFGGQSEYFQPTTAAGACMYGLKESGFDLQDTDNYYKWMDKTSVLDLAETGTYEGPEEVKEYVDFTKADFFDYYKRSGPLDITPIRTTYDECHVLFVTTTKAQVKKEFNPAGACLETVFGYTLRFAPKPFKVHRIDLFYSPEFTSKLFSDGLETDAVRDYICDIMEDKCQDTFKFNNLTTSSCQAEYDSLPPINDAGYLDDRSKGCRVLHSASAAINKNNCPHLSFSPQEDNLGRTKCQKSKGKKPEDIFPAIELEKIKAKGHQWGFPDLLYETCEYNANYVAEVGGQELDSNKFSMSESIPIAKLNDGQFAVYAAFIMWATMVLTGLGWECLVWRSFLRGRWTEEMESRWKIAQFVFPILGATTVGLANTGNWLALPFLVITMWKLGFPETLMHIYSCLYDKEKSSVSRLVSFIIGMGSIIHHSASAMYVAILLTHVIPTTPELVAVTLPLVMQHWFVLLKYNYKLLYIILEILVEAWWEWTAFSVLESIHELHWTGGITIAAMLWAHWCYFGGGIIALLFGKEEASALFVAEQDIENVRRLTCLSFGPFNHEEMESMEGSENEASQSCQSNHLEIDRLMAGETIRIKNTESKDWEF